MSRVRMLMLAAATAAAASFPFASSARAFSDGACDGRNSWLVSEACTYCEWGGSCGSCKIKDCTQQAF